jgi:hypothetical protein
MQCFCLSGGAQPLAAKQSIAAALLLATALFLHAAPAAATCGDVTGDDNVTVTDAFAVLKSAVGQPVDLVCTGDCTELEERVVELEEAVLALGDLAARVEELEELLAGLHVEGDSLVLTGMNLRIVNGTGSTGGTTNGKGNLVLGYDETNSGDSRTGSHNLVIGRFHTYTGYGAIVAGEDNSVRGKGSSVLGGTRSRSIGDLAVVVGGYGHDARGEASVVAGGEENQTEGRYCAVAGGIANGCSGRGAVVSGGAQNSSSATAGTVSGGRLRGMITNFGWQGGGLFQVQ